MTAQEQQLIDELVERIRSTGAQDKDQDAENRLKQGLAGSPDALYILSQTVIVQKYGLEQAQQRLQAMQAELDSLREQSAQPAARPSGGSFLSNIFGGGTPPASAPAAPSGANWQQVNNPGSPQAGSVPPSAYPAPGSYGSGGYGYSQPSGWGAPSPSGGGFLRNALQTAAGVAMGEVAFQGMESLFHGFGGGDGYGRGFEGTRPSETIINNYNDRDEPRHDGFDGSRDRDDSSFYNPHDDASRDDDTRVFAGSSGNHSDTRDDDSNDSGFLQGSDPDDTGDYDSNDGDDFDSGDDGSSGDDDGS